MGLDQYAYSKDSNGEEQEIAYWRKHNRLQGWMEQLWEDKGRPNFLDGAEETGMGDFNCVPLPITEEDLDDLEDNVCGKTLPDTHGFFFGNDSFEWEDENGNSFEENDYYYKEDDIDFIEKARQALKEKKEVYYNCWW